MFRGGILSLDDRVGLAGLVRLKEGCVNDIMWLRGVWMTALNQSINKRHSSCSSLSSRLHASGLECPSPFSTTSKPYHIGHSRILRVSIPLLSCRKMDSQRYRGMRPDVEWFCFTFQSGRVSLTGFPMVRSTIHPRL